MDTAGKNQTMIVTLTVGQLRDLIHGVVTDALTARPVPELLNLKQVRERYSVGRGALIAAARRTEIELFRGPKQTLLVRAADLERWLTTRRYVAPHQGPAPQTMEAWERETERELARLTQESTADHASMSSAASRAIERAMAEGRLRTLSPKEMEQTRRSNRRTRRS